MLRSGNARLGSDSYRETRRVACSCTRGVIGFAYLARKIAQTSLHLLDDMPAHGVAAAVGTAAALRIA
jgi:hypothetical protein